MEFRKSHIIYDAVEETLPDTEMARIVREASGLYANIDVDAESRKLIFLYTTLQVLK